MTEKIKNDLLANPAVVSDNNISSVLNGQAAHTITETADHQSATASDTDWSDPVRRAYKYSYSALYLNVDLYL